MASGGWFSSLLPASTILRDFQAKAAIAKCRSAGIRVIMITGDYPETATTIAGALGVTRRHNVTSQVIEISMTYRADRHPNHTPIYSQSL